MGHDGHDHDGHDHGHDHAHSHRHHGHGPHHHASHGVDESPAHAHRAAAKQAVKAFVVTASDTRTEDTDASGRFLVESLGDLGHAVLGRELVKDEPLLIAHALGKARAAGADVAIVTGGTGIAKRDHSYEAVRGLLAKELPGFGELFRMLSFEEIGSAAMLTRATAGVTADGMVVFVLPGSTGACRLAMRRLIGPELPHLVGETKRQE